LKIFTENFMRCITLQ